MDGTAGNINIVEFGSGSAQQTKQPHQFRAFIVASFQKRRLDEYRNTAFYQLGNDHQALGRDFIRVDEMGGHLHAFAAFLEFEVFSLQVTQQFCIVRQEEMRVVGDASGGQAQGACIGGNVWHDVRAALD